MRKPVRSRLFPLVYPELNPPIYLCALRQVFAKILSEHI